MLQYSIMAFDIEGGIHTEGASAVDAEENG
jgi:hypothetical protein